jgi:TonB family protein
MNAIADRWEPEQVRLWTGSAFAALLVHLVPAALLVLYIHWSARPSPLAGSPAALDVELASLPSASSTSASSLQPSQSQKQLQASRAQLAAVDTVRPLGQMQSVPQPDVAPSDAARVADAGATSVPAESSDLGASGASDPGFQLWEDEMVARLASHKDYPSSALLAVQQDTVTLQISVDRTGQVTYSRVDSTHHYPALEQEVQQMLRLAGSMPAPPSEAAGLVFSVPVQFSLDFAPDILCGASGCPKSEDGKQSKPKAVAPPPPTLASCTAPDSPGPAPAGSTATLERMRAYREQLNQYLAAAGTQLACLSQVRETDTVAMRDTLTQQLKSMVDDFNAQAHTFETKAQAQALQAQQARQQQAQALAGQVYATCTPPRVSQAPGTLSTKDAASFRRQLIGDQAAVRAYVDCLRQAELAAAAPDRGLAGDQRAQLAQTALQLGDAAIQSFNQLVGKFNAQVPHLRQALVAEQQNLAEAVVRGAAIFPSSVWDLPVPLPTGECVYITQSGQSYHAQLCDPTYVTTISDLSQIIRNSYNSANPTPGTVITKALADTAADNALPQATQQEAIAAQHGFPADGADCGGPHICPPPILGIAVTTEAGFGGQVQPTGPQQQTISYSVSELQVAGRRISMTISRSSDHDAGSEGMSAVHFDLVLSPDNQTLRGYCWTGEQRQQCTLVRHLSAPSPENPRR